MRDSEVVASIVAGDPEGLASAYDRYADPLYKYCRTLLRDPADAADAVQDTFVIAASRLSGLGHPGSLRAWLFTVARNESRRAPRAGQETTPAPDEAPGVSDDVADAAEAAGRGGLRTLLDRACEGLSPGEREVIELRLRAGLEPAEVASVLGVSRNHAQALFSRARDSLEVCLAVLLVGRAGRADCGELAAILADWDERLTVPLRGRVHRHIENCAACSARRALELRPAMLGGLTASTALAAGASASFRHSPGAPAGLKAHTIALATGGGADAAAHRAAVLGHAGTFGRGGFPRAAGRGAASPRSSSHGQTAVAAAVVIAVIIAAVAFALTANGQGFRPAAAAGPKPSVPTRVRAVPSPTASASPVITRAKPTPAPTTAAATATAALAATAGAPPATTAAPSTQVSAPESAPASASPGPASSSPAPTARPSTSPTPAPRPSPTPTGTLTMVPGGGPLIVASGSRPLLLVATGGTVNWSATIANNPAGAIGLSQSSGTLTAASTTATLTITASQFVPCISASYPTITINPGGTQYIVCTGFIRPLPNPGHKHHKHGHGHHRRRHSDVPAGPATPTLAGFAMSAPARQRGQ